MPEEAEHLIPKPPPEDEDEPRTLTPFRVINAGEDTLDTDERVVFSDFRPVPVPADTPDPLPESPKGESAPEPAPSPESTQTEELPTSETTVETPASKGAGSLSQSEAGKQTSSSDTKTG